MPSETPAPEFLKFLRRLDQEFPGDTPLHLIMDNYGTHKHEKVTAWLRRHPRFVSHFVPTSSSWMNLVERWFGHLDNKAIKRGVDWPPFLRQTVKTHFSSDGELSHGIVTQAVQSGI
jgi:transposase